MTAMTHPGAVMSRLEEIEKDLAKRQNEYEEAAENRARLIRTWEKRMAYARMTAKGSDAEARKAAALITAIEQDGLYELLAEAEARFEALKVVNRVLETRASIGQSILRAQGRA